MSLPADTPLRGLALAVIDTEFTGLDEDDRICEIAVIHATLGRPEETRVAFSSRVKPPVPMSARAAKLTGITDADLASAPPWGAVELKVRKAVAGRALLAYNSPADHGVLLREGVDLGWPWLDAMPLAKTVDKYERSKTLASVAQRRGIVVDAHGAAGDAITTALVYETLLREAHASGVRYGRTLGELLEWTERAARWQEADFCAYVRRRGATGPRPDCPWHELAGLPLPEWPETKPTGSCSRCKAPVVYRVSQAGEVSLVDAESQQAHSCEAQTGL